ncbi:glutamyl aminopeptidase-like [Mercenaria mercenaria]|uniref:glutamyl aminopeptidase-like n=1 Tax=Mercenaria mercenaria TaxID=6596 RepID=UPI00234F3EEA|nr:glutamyl aminopeptidase-like [Mercenaria mercenaria]
MASDPNGHFADYVTSVFQYLSWKPIGRTLAWNYLTTNWDYFLQERFTERDTEMYYIISYISEGFSTFEELEKLQVFVADVTKDLSLRYFISYAFQRAIERTVNNIERASVYVPVMEKWLNDQGY